MSKQIQESVKVYNSSFPDTNDVFEMSASEMH